MLNPISKALDEVKRRIPREILEVVFLKRNTILGQSTANWRRAPVSIDESILAEVIRTRVMVDANLVGGTETMIPLNNIPCTMDPEFNYISYYHIPKEKTGGRSIVSVLNITYADATKLAAYGGSGTVNNSPMLYAGQGMVNAYAAIPMVSTAYVQLVGENTVMVKDSTVLPPNVALRCVLAVDENMSHLQMRAVHPFCKLVELAVKSHIHNEYIIPLDVGQLYAGQNIGRIRDIIDSYADAEELYQEYLKNKWQKISYMNDRETMTRGVKLLIGSIR